MQYRIRHPGLFIVRFPSTRFLKISEKPKAPKCSVAACGKCHFFSASPPPTTSPPRRPGSGAEIEIPPVQDKAGQRTASPLPSQSTTHSHPQPSPASGSSSSSGGGGGSFTKQQQPKKSGDSFPPSPFPPTCPEERTKMRLASSLPLLHFALALALFSAFLLRGGSARSLRGGIPLRAARRSLPVGSGGVVETDGADGGAAGLLVLPPRVRRLGGGGGGGDDDDDDDDDDAISTGEDDVSTDALPPGLGGSSTSPPRAYSVATQGQGQGQPPPWSPRPATPIAATSAALTQRQNVFERPPPPPPQQQQQQNPTGAPRVDTSSNDALGVVPYLYPNVPGGGAGGGGATNKVSPHAQPWWGSEASRPGPPPPVESGTLLSEIMGGGGGGGVGGRPVQGRPIASPHLVPGVVHLAQEAAGKVRKEKEAKAAKEAKGGVPPGQGGGGGGLNKATPASIALKGPPRPGGDGISTDRHHVKDREREKAGDREQEGKGRGQGQAGEGQGAEEEEVRVRPTTRGQQQQRRRRQRQGGMCMFRFLYWGGGRMQGPPGLCSVPWTRAH